MKKLVVTMLLTLCVGWMASCHRNGLPSQFSSQDSVPNEVKNKKENIIHTYYGDLDTDTCQSIREEDGTMTYLIRKTKLTEEQAKVLGLDYMYLLDFYNPDHNVYFEIASGSDGGNSQRIYYNPYNEK